MLCVVVYKSVYMRLYKNQQLHVITAVPSTEWQREGVCSKVSFQISATTYNSIVTDSVVKMTLENILLEPTLNSVKGVMIMDNNGARILAKYYDEDIFPNTAAQKKFEKTLFNKTHKVDMDMDLQVIIHLGIQI